MKTRQALVRAFVKANHNVDNTIARYKNFICGLWAENAQGELIGAMSACFTWRKDGWHFREFVTEAYDALYQRGRGEKRLAEAWGKMELFSVKPVDINRVKKFEAKIEKAFAERERLINELEAIGENIWGKDEFWA